MDRMFYADRLQAKGGQTAALLTQVVFEYSDEVYGRSGVQTAVRQVKI